MVYFGNIFDGFIYALCSGGELRKIIWAAQRLWSFNGGDYRRAALRVRRRDDPVIAAMARGRNEFSRSERVHDHRP